MERFWPKHRRHHKLDALFARKKKWPDFVNVNEWILSIDGWSTSRSMRREIEIVSNQNEKQASSLLSVMHKTGPPVIM